MSGPNAVSLDHRSSTMFSERGTYAVAATEEGDVKKNITESQMATKRAALNVMNDPWWNCDFGDKKQETYLCEDKDKISNTVCLNYGVARSKLYSHVKGTVTEKVWTWCTAYCMLGLVLFVIYRTTTDNEKCALWPGDGKYRHAWYDDADPSDLYYEGEDDDRVHNENSTKISGPADIKCRPAWFNEQFASLSHVYFESARLGEIVLTLFVGVAYKRYQTYYWNARKIQGGINNLALIVGTMIDTTNKTPESVELQRAFERYLTLLKILTYMNVSPLIKNKLTITDLEKRIVGINQLVTKEELAILQFTIDPKSNPCPEGGCPMPGAAGNGPMNTILVWLQMTFDRMLEEKVTCGRMSEARITSYCVQFQDHLMTLRGSMATFAFLTQFPTPLAYAHMLQMLVDFICIACPFAMIFSIDTIVVKKAGFIEHSPWATLPLTLIGILFTTYFFQGLLSLAKALNSPLGEKVDKKTGMLKDQEFMLNVKQIIKQTRMGQYSLLNASIGAPMICQPDKKD